MTTLIFNTDKALGLIIAVVVTVALVQDRDGGKLVFTNVQNQLRLEKVWAAHSVMTEATEANFLPGPRNIVRGKWRLFFETRARKGWWSCLDVELSSVPLDDLTVVAC